MKLEIAKKTKLLLLFMILIFNIQPSTAYDPRLVDTYHYSLNEGDMLIFNINFSEPLFEEDYQWENGILEITAKTDMANIKQQFDDSNHPVNIAMNDYLAYTLNGNDIPTKITRYIDEYFLFPRNITLRDKITKLGLIEFYRSLNYSEGTDFEIDGDKLLIISIDGSYIIDVDTGIVLEWSSTTDDGIYIKFIFLDLLRANTKPVHNVETTTIIQKEFVSANLPFSFLSGLFGLSSILMYLLFRKKESVN